MGLAASSPPPPMVSILAAVQVVCTPNGVVNSVDSEKLADDHHNCTTCLAPCKGSALVGPVMAAAIPQGRLDLLSPVSFGASTLKQEWVPVQSRAPPMIL